ncbi:X-Pro dipeptidyl-peptidase C-terminal non-catalytic domain-containing protein [Exophiala viscosa]|uniref:X-Pro dipeptidyl-peptidase C-terminal non-catalytic domain-containing protein n=1 Tax=Exophiala viscosa TaxID=2486360 RepID=UPI002194CF3D|nr:X-Pro dipeptidyl-peptidase C-terminal non-catalytic domain-containing protein [Exophiala viscosa]
MPIDKSWSGYAKGTIPDLGIDWAWQDATPPDEPNRDPEVAYIPLGYEKKTLPRGWQKTPENKPLDLDIIFEKDVSIILRDGVKIYADIYRPAQTDGKKIPIIVPYSPYGKGGGGANLMDVVPYRVGVPKSRQSGLEKFEGPDPNEWCGRGYAVLDPNARGSFDSEGDLYFFGPKDGEDCYDIIEYGAQLEWCNGAVGMAGNSWLGISQYWAAMQQPPHLKAIAPWEGYSDLYRDMMRRGGIPWAPFLKWVLLGVPGRGRQEDVPTMAFRHEFFDKYWENKRVDFSKIKVPSYILGSYSSMLHTVGAVRAWQGIDNQDKWLRFHPHQEWYEDYYHQSVEDLDRFFTKYLKGEDNAWELTPKVRVSLYRYGDKYPVYDQIEADYPSPRTKYTKLFLTPSKSLEIAPKTHVAADEIHSYDSTTREILSYDYIFPEKTTLAGFSKLRIFVSCLDHDDLDIYVMLRKLSADGDLMEQSNVPLHELPLDIKSVKDVKNVNPVKYLGPTGILRASHRETDPEKSTEYWPFHPHTRTDLVRPPGKIVEMNIGIWPMGVVYEKGEGLRLQISGKTMALPEWDNPHVKHQEPVFNRGIHRLHLGGEYAGESYLLVPRL